MSVVTEASAVEIALRLADRMLDPAETAMRGDTPYFSIRSHGLAGYSGLAVFFVAVVQARDEMRYRHALHAYPTAAAHLGQPVWRSLFGGLPGLLVASQYASLVDPQYAHLAARCAQVLDDYALAHPFERRPVAGMNEYDLINGAAGYALAMRVAARVERAEPALEYLAWMLDDASGGRWCAPHPMRLEEPPESDLGLAHGLAGMLAALALASGDERHDGVLSSACDWLCRCAERGSVPQGFPANVGPAGTVWGRHAWCYGTPGTATALLVAAQKAKNEAAAGLAVAVLRDQIAIPLERWRIDDYALCHGHSGNALAYTVAGRLANDEMLRAHGAALFERTIGAYDETFPFGYRFMAPDGETDTAALLGGASGIGLALLTAAGACDASWMPAFGLPALA